MSLDDDVDMNMDDLDAAFDGDMIEEEDIDGDHGGGNDGT